ETTEDPMDFVVEVHSARLRVDARPSVEHHGRDAVPGEEEGRGHPRRAGSHDHHRSSAQVPLLGRGAGAHGAGSEVWSSVVCTAVRMAYRAGMSPTPRTPAAPSTVTVSTTEPSSTAPTTSTTPSTSARASATSRWAASARSAGLEGVPTRVTGGSSRWD